MSPDRPLMNKYTIVYNSISYKLMTLRQKNWGYLKRNNEVKVLKKSLVNLQTTFFEKLADTGIFDSDVASKILRATSNNFCPFRD